MTTDDWWNFEVRRIIEEDIVNLIKSQRIRWYGDTYTEGKQSHHEEDNGMGTNNKQTKRKAKNKMGGPGDGEKTLGGQQNAKWFTVTIESAEL